MGEPLSPSSSGMVGSRPWSRRSHSASSPRRRSRTCARCILGTSQERDEGNPAHGTHMTPRQSRQTPGQSLPDSLRNCLSLDIEVSRKSGQIVAAAACNPQTGRTWRARGPLTQQPVAGARPDCGRGGPPRGPQHTHVRPAAAESAARRTGAAGHAGPRHPAPEPPGVSGTPVPPAREALPGRGPDPHHSQRPAAGQPANPAGPGSPADPAAGEHIARAAFGLALADRPRGGPRLRCLLHRGETASRTDARAGQGGAVALPGREGLPHRGPGADGHRRRLGLAGGLRDRLDVDGRHQLGHTALGAAASPRYRRPGEKAQGGNLHRRRTRRTTTGRACGWGSGRACPPGSARALPARPR